MPKKDEDEEILLPVSPVVKGTGSNALPRHNGGSKAAPGRPASNGTAAAPSRTPVLVPRASSRASGVRSSFSTSVSEQVRSVAWCMGSSHRGDRDWEVMVHEARGEPRPVSNRPRAGEVNGFASIIPVYCALGRSVAWSAWT